MSDLFDDLSSTVRVLAECRSGSRYAPLGSDTIDVLTMEGGGRFEPAILGSCLSSWI